MQNKLREAIESEEYERAAKLRDDIKKMTGNN
ncbi:MAG: UvrB/UvrC motif-containing protein [Ignavibacteriaceae bacterium]